MAKLYNPGEEEEFVQHLSKENIEALRIAMDKKMKIPCPRCSGTGQKLEPLFVDSSKAVLKNCYLCKATGEIDG